MNSIKLFCLLIIASIFVILPRQTNATNNGKYVEIKIPFANVYEYLDPKSTVLKQAKKGDHLELVYEGTSWYQVKVREKVGWLEKKSGEVVASPNYNLTSTMIFILILLAGTVGIVWYYISRQKVAEI